MARARKQTASPKPTEVRTVDRTAAIPSGLTMLGDDWTIEDGVYSSPVPGNDAQTLISAKTFRNGSVEASITPLESFGKRADGGQSLEATLVLRYQGSGSYYLAGIGGWGRKFYIAKAAPQGFWIHLASTGSLATIRKAATYKLRFECTGNRLVLYENDVALLSVLDEDYQVGQWGLRTWNTSARFAQVRPVVDPLQCFVVMPFATEFSFVYEVIREVMNEFGITCIRADQLAISRPVIDDIRAQISAADLILVDFTGRNPNVYFEAGLADAWKKKWIVLAQSVDDLSFDVKHIRTLIYSNRMGMDVQLRAGLRNAVAETTGLRKAQP